MASKDLDALTSEYEAALAAHQDNPDDEKKRAAADKAASKLTEAREADRQGRAGVGVVIEDGDE